MGIRTQRRTNPDYEIVDLQEEHLPAFCGCLTPYEAAILEAGSIKIDWHRRRHEQGFGAKLARRSDGALVGMIQYVPIEESSATGEDLYFVVCIWIPPARRNPGGHQRRNGIGKALLKAAEDEVRSKGAGGLAVWGTALPFFMRSSWFRRHGYATVDKTGFTELMWKSFKPDTQPPTWRNPVSPDPAEAPEGKVTVTRFVNGICPAMNTIHRRFKRAAEEVGEKVVLKTIDTSDPQIIHTWGQTDAVYINNREFPMGPPPAYHKILRTLKREVNKL